MRIAIAQINSTIGDFSGNTEKILAFSRRALREQQAGLALFPELAVCGYPPMDLLDQDRFVESNIRAVRILQRELPRNIAVGVGFVGRNPYSGGKTLVNEYGFILDGKLVFEQIKTLLPTYDVFDEARNFESACEWNVFEWKDERIGVAICEDVWRETAAPGTRYVRDPVRLLLDRGISLLCIPSASPYYAGKLQVRRALAERISGRGDLPIVYVNAVGANDSIIFDGRSFVVSPGADRKAPSERTGPAVRLIARSFEEDLVTWDSAGSPEGAVLPGSPAVSPGPGGFNGSPETGGCGKADLFDAGLSRSELDALEDAMVLGIREYMEKCGFSRAHLGLSGGIDSSLVAYLAVKALGGGKVAGFGMPSRFSSRGSKDDAEELARNLGCSYTPLPIEPVYVSFLAALKDVFQDRPFDIAEENLQARIDRKSVV
jgi:NAD+ synthase (glutamine-hydrolysing)